MPAVRVGLAVSAAAGARRARQDAAAVPDDDWWRQRLFSAVGTTLAALATLRPLAVLVEDLHWADSTTSGPARAPAEQRTGAAPGGHLPPGRSDRPGRHCRLAGTGAAAAHGHHDGACAARPRRERRAARADG